MESLGLRTFFNPVFTRDQGSLSSVYKHVHGESTLTMEPLSTYNSFLNKYSNSRHLRELINIVFGWQCDEVPK
jgi:hypothetical protein